jgi:hypothetical protein
LSEVVIAAARSAATLNADIGIIFRVVPMAGAGWWPGTEKEERVAVMSYYSWRMATKKHSQ